MIDDRPGMVLYIEPQGAPETPVNDELTGAMERELAAGESDGRYYRGWHTCSCGRKSTNTDYVLSDGSLTNSLAAHYLRDHRSEVPAEQLDRVRALT